MISLLMQYSKGAIALNSEKDFELLYSNPQGEFVLNRDLVLTGTREPLDFSGVLDGQRYQLTFTGSLFRYIDNARFRLVAITSGDGVLATRISGSAFEQVNLTGLSLNKVENSQFLQSRLTSHKKLFEFSENNIFSGTKFETSIKVDCAILNSQDDSYSNVAIVSQGGQYPFIFMATNSSFSTVQATASFESRDSAFMFSISQCEMHTFNTHFDILGGYFNGLVQLVLSSNLTEISQTLTFTQSASLCGLILQSQNLTMKNISVFQIGQSNFSYYYPVFNIFSGELQQIGIYLDVVCTTSLDYGTLFSQANNSKIKQVYISYDDLSISFDYAASSSLLGALQTNSSVLQAILVGNVTIPDSQKLYFSLFIANNYGLLQQSYASLNVGLNGQEIQAGLYSVVCEACTINQTEVLKSEITINYASVLGSAMLVESSGDYLLTQCTFDSLVSIEAENATFCPVVYNILSKASIVAIKLVLQLDLVASSSQCTLFGGYALEKTTHVEDVLIVLTSSTLHSLSLGFNLAFDASRIYVDCSSDIAHDGLPNCATMQSDAFITANLTQPCWYRAHRQQNGYPYIQDNLFCEQGQIRQTDNATSEMNASVYLYMQLAFWKPIYDFCVGNCRGAEISPQALFCDNSSQKFCVGSENDQIMIAEACNNENEHTTCNEGKTICDRDSEIINGECEQRCQKCIFGYCRQGSCVCELNYKGEFCDEFDCKMQKQQCFGLGTCTQVNGLPVCQCADPQYYYQSGRCAEFLCPDLKKNQGVCISNGPACFEHYVLENNTCDACIKGYQMSHEVCKKNVNTGAIVGGVIGGIAALIGIAIAVYCLKQKKQSTGPSSQAKSGTLASI